MFQRILSGLVKTLPVPTAKLNLQCGFEMKNAISNPMKNQPTANFSSLIPNIQYPASSIKNDAAGLLKVKPPIVHQIRTVVKHSLIDGKKISMEEVPKRFFRLNWGIWIRVRAGRSRRLWKKSMKRRLRSQEHVFVVRHRSKVFDIMVNHYWRRPTYYVDSPYEPYQNRENFHLTRKKPWRPEGVDYET